MRWNYLLIWIIGAVWFGYWSFGALWTYYLDLEERRRNRASVRRHRVWRTELAEQQITSTQCPFPDNLEIEEKIEDTVNCTDGNLHDDVESSATVIVDIPCPSNTISFKEHLGCDNDETSYMQEQLCIVDKQISVAEGKCPSKNSDSIEILATSFSELSIISSPTQSLTQSSDDTASCTESITVESSDSTTDMPPLTQYSDKTLPSTESITEDLIRNKEETVATSNATNEQLATVEDSGNFNTSTDLSTLTLSSDEPPPSVEAITDVVESRGDTLVTTTYEPQASTFQSSASLKFTTSTDLSEVVVEDSGSFSETTTCSFVPLLLSDATTLTSSLDETASCTESITVEGADGKPDTEPITEEIVMSKEETTSSVIYEPLVLATLEDPVSSITTSTDFSTLAQSSNETPLDVSESMGETIVTTYEPLASPVVRSSVNCTTSTNSLPSAQFSTIFSDTGMVVNTKEILTNSNATMESQKQPEIVVEDLACSTETTTCFLLSSLMTATTTLTQSLDETASCPESTTVTVQGSDSTTDTPTITQCSSETPLSTEPITEEILRSKEETTSSATYEQLAKGEEDSSSFTTSTDLSTLTLSSSPAIEAILDIEESRGDTMVTTYEPLACTDIGSSATLKLISSTDLSPLTKFSTTYSDTGMVESTKGIQTNSNATTEPQKQPEVVVKSSSSFTDTTPCFFVPSLMSDTTTLSQSLDETASCPESTTLTVHSTTIMPPITQCSGETSPSTESIAEEIVRSKEETVVTSSVAYEQLAEVEDSGNFTTSTTQCSGEKHSSAESITEDIVRSKEESVVTSSECSVSITTSTDLSTLTCIESSDERPPTTEATHDAVEGKGESVVTTYNPLADSLTTSTDLTSPALSLTSPSDNGIDVVDLVSIEESLTLGLLPVKRPLSFQPGSNKEKLLTLDCACQCNWCNEHVRNCPHTKATACCLLEKKEKDWLNDDFYFLLHGTSSRSHSKRQSKKSVRKHSKCGQSSQTISNQRPEQAASPVSYSTKSTKKNIEEKNKLNNELSFPQNTSRSFFLTSGKQQMKSYAMATETTNFKTQSSLLSSTQAQTQRKGPTQRVNESYSGAVTSTKKNYSLPSISLVQSLIIGRTPIPKDQKSSLKSYAVATKPTKTASPSSNVQPQASDFSRKSSHNQGKGKCKNNAQCHRNGPNKQQTNSIKTTAAQKSSDKSVSTQRGSQRRRKPFQTQRADN